jgi:hypothetical protein
MLTERQRKRDTPRHWFLCWCSLQQLTEYLHGLEMMHSKSRKGDSMHDKQSINIWKSHQDGGVVVGSGPLTSSGEEQGGAAGGY